MARIEGPVVAAVQGVAAENWLECCERSSPALHTFPVCALGDTTAFVVKAAGGSRDGSR